MNYSELKTLIDAYVNRNGVQAITGSILNGVLNEMVDQLGRGYQIMGVAEPTDDPGLPDGPECWFAGNPGTYTNFGGITVVDGEIALLCYDTGWTKRTFFDGFADVEATVDNEVGTPSCDVSYSDGTLTFNFYNIKGDPGLPGEDGQAGTPGTPAGFGSVTASVNDETGTPEVTVSTSGPDTAKDIDFSFKNLKGETGDAAGFGVVVASVDANVGIPSVDVFTSGPDTAKDINFAFKNLRGPQGSAGTPAGFGTVLATVDNNVGTPEVDVLSSGPDSAKNFTFRFHNIKGQQGEQGERGEQGVPGPIGPAGVQSAEVSVDNNTGIPYATASVVNGVLSISFYNIKGNQGDTGVSADYPIAIVNNLTTADAASALSAQMGVQLEGEINKLEKRLYGVWEIPDQPGVLLGQTIVVTGWPGYTHKVIPINGVSTVQVKANSENTANFVLVKTYTPSTGPAVSYDLATGETERRTVNPGATSAVVNVPGDANYLLISNLYGDNGDGKPAQLLFDGYDVLSGDLDVLQTEIDRTNGRVDTVVNKVGALNVGFTQGGLNNGQPSVASSRVRLTVPVNNKVGTIKFSATSPYQIYQVAEYADDSFDSFLSIDAVQAYEQTLQTGKYVELVFRKTDNSDFTPEDLIPNVSYSVPGSIEEEIAGLSGRMDDADVIDKIYLSDRSGEVQANPALFGMSNIYINAQGALYWVESTSRVSILEGNLLYLRAGDTIRSKSARAYMYLLYSADGEHYTGSGWYNNQTITISDEGYYAIIMRWNPEVDVTDKEALLEQFEVTTTGISQNLKAYADKVAAQYSVNANGKGNTYYRGVEKLSFDVNNDRFLCQKTQVMTQTAIEAGDNMYQQGMAIINGKILSFTDTTDSAHTGFIYDVTDGSYIGTIDVTNLGDNHCNSAQFTDVYYDENDTYPLMFLSECIGRGDFSLNKLYVIRFVESGDNLVGTIVKIITPSSEIVGANYGADYAYNQLTREIVVLCNTYNYSAVENETNKTNVYVFDCPDLTDGVNTTLSGIKRHFYLSYCIIQAAFVKNNMLVATVQKMTIINGDPITLAWPQSMLICVDLNSGVILSYVPIDRTIEPEGCSYYDKAVYVAYHKGNATGEQEAFRVEKYEF